MATYTITQVEPGSSSFELQSFSSQKKIKVGDVEDVRGDAAPPSDTVEALQVWHSPRINMFRVFVTF